MEEITVGETDGHVVSRVSSFIVGQCSRIEVHGFDRVIVYVMVTHMYPFNFNLVDHMRDTMEKKLKHASASDLGE